MRLMHKGVAVSPGVVVGVAYRVDSVFGSAESQTLPDGEPIGQEIERFELAVATSAQELEAIVQKVAEQLGAAEADIFKTHLQIVNDEGMLAKVRSLIDTKRMTALS